MIAPWLLPALLGIPIMGIVLIALGAKPRTTALLVSVLNFVPGLLLAGMVLRSGEVLFGPEPIPVRDVFPVKFILGMDGLSLPMVWLTLGVTLAAMGVTKEGIKREKEYFICLLLVGVGAIGAFISVDLFYFFSFHEVALIPTFLLIGIWGQGDRSGAAWRMTLYLMFGSLVLLVGLIGLVLTVPETARTLDWRVLTETLKASPIAPGTQTLLAALLLVGFGTLVSLVPFHSWAPGGYASAPAPAAMLHAGVLKKFGLYGLLRIALPMLPSGCGLISGTVLGLGGALLLMVAHGFSAALGFAVAGEIGQRTGTTWMKDLGGLAKRAPKLWFYLMIAVMASIGLPGLANFAGEILIFFGAWSSHPFLVVVAAWGVVLSAVAMLRAVRAIAFGPTAKAVEASEPADLKGVTEVWPYAFLTFLLFLIGIVPTVILGPARPVLERLLSP
ncbi:MAG: proton-conducting transporter membrane subunit [Verrucomicrobia bacterium]|nr:proton-conducting transporter membrane subunit [Verrucomicrobiota bacterium]